MEDQNNTPKTITERILEVQPMTGGETTIPFQILNSSDRIKKDEWHCIHDFLYGYGYSNEAQDKTVWFGDAQSLLQIDLYRAFGSGWRCLEGDEVTRIEEIHEQLQPHIEARNAERLKKYEATKNIAQFTKFSIPLIKRKFPKF
jgi:hypothetical protein